MSLLGEFERRLERAVEGFFARVFRSSVHPVEIGKRLLRVMEDGKVTGLRRTYVPSAYRISLSQNDYERLAPIQAKLVEELEVFVSEAAKQQGWEIPDPPRVSFAAGARLSPGEFHIEAEPVSAPSRARTAAGLVGPPRPGTASVPADTRPRGPRPVSAGTEATAATAFLVVMGDAGPMETVPLAGRVRMGRQADNDLVIPDPGVSRHHAEVAERSGDFYLSDLGSTNGTSVNGSPVTVEHRLHEGDRIVLGHTAIEFRRG